ncbi:MAG: twin-arginine translocase TatA/TatE family subunit [Pseudomonadota bacterium]
MGTFSIWHWLIVLAVALLLFGGGGKIKKIMGDVGSGITAFKKGLKDEEKKGDDEDDAKRIEETPSEVASSSEEKDKAANG